MQISLFVNHMNKIVKAVLTIAVFSFMCFGIFNKKVFAADTCDCIGNTYYCYYYDMCNAVTYAQCCEPPAPAGISCWCDFISGPASGGGNVYCGHYSVWEECSISCTPTGCTPPPGGGTCTPCSCPAPLVESQPSNPPHPVEEYYISSCTDTGTCTDPQTRSCYEELDPPPTIELTINHESVPTTRGFVSSTHTGAGKFENGNDDRVNEPINMIAKYTDDKSADQIEAIYVWFSQSGTTPYTPKVFTDTGTQRTLNKSEYGFMLRKVSGNWIPYLPNVEGVDDLINNKWVRATYSYEGTIPVLSIKGPDQKVMVKVLINSISNSGKSVLLDFSMSFNSYEDSSVTEGKYNIFLMANDVFGFTPYDNYEDKDESLKTAIHNKWVTPSRIRYFDLWNLTDKDWTVDLGKPSVDNLSVFVEKINNLPLLKFVWQLSDTFGIYGVVGNLYKGEDLNIQSFAVKSINPGATDLNTPYIPPVLDKDTIVGHLNTNYLFKIVNTSNTGYVYINPGENRKGTIQFYLTVFDKAGNLDTQFVSFDLRDWIVTQGGLVYSRGGIDITPKEIEGDTLWTSIDLLSRLLPSKADLSTELVGNSLTSNPLPPLKSSVTKGYAINSMAISNETSYYTKLKNLFDERKDSMVPKVEEREFGGSFSGDLRSNTHPERIIFVDRKGDLKINNNMNCRARAIIFVDGNLTIDGDIKNTTDQDRYACIFVVSGNLVIGDGQPSSSAVKIGYDEINAYILVDRTITFAPESDHTILDGLYINGGIHALNKNEELGSGIILNRYLKLGERYQHPVVVVDYHSKYGVFAQELFGSEMKLQKVEVGYK